MVNIYRSDPNLAHVYTLSPVPTGSVHGPRIRGTRKFSYLLKRICVSSYGQSTVRVMAYNKNGDGAATEITATQTEIPSPYRHHRASAARAQV